MIMSEKDDTPRVSSPEQEDPTQKGYTIIDVKVYKDTYGLSDDGEIETQIINIFGRENEYV